MFSIFNTRWINYYLIFGAYIPYYNNFKESRSSDGLSRDGKIAVASSVTVVFVASITFFIVGFLCGHFCQKKRKLTSAAGGETTPPGVATGGQTQIPYYDDVVLKQEVELKENLAYGPLK